MKLRVLTPERTVLEADVDAVQAQAVDGSLAVLPRHQPLLTPLSVGVLRARMGGDEQAVAVMGGLFQTDGETVTVLAEVAELGAEIDVARARQAQDRAEARLRSRESGLDLQRAEMALAKAAARIKAAGRG